jgi:hypothetical protein
MDLTTSLTGAFTEYRDDRDRRVYEESNAAAVEAANTKSQAKSEANSASIMTAASSTISKRKAISTGQLAGASGKSLAMFAPKALKGMTADIPLALTEGLKNVPRYYGDTPRDHGSVTDFKSGATVAGKTFAWGFVDGLSDMVAKPYQGAQKEGVKGAAKGLGKGMVSLATKSGAGMFGLVGYTSAGIAKSLRTAVYTKTRRSIAEARHAEGRWLAAKSSYGADKIGKIFVSFEALRRKGS